VLSAFTTIVRLAWDLILWCGLLLRPRNSLEAENLLLRRQPTRVGAEGFEVPGLVTSAELMTIVRNPALLSKTTFYRDGRVLTAAEVPSELGL
jgi:hypothetical protein